MKANLMRKVRLIVPFGEKAPRHGTGVWRFWGVDGKFAESERLLLDAGWTHIKRWREYTYWQIPKGLTSVEVPIVSTEIPDRQTVRQFGQKLHAAGTAISGRQYGWPYLYRPEINEPDYDGRMYQAPAYFEIGDMAWSVVARWTDSAAQWNDLESNIMAEVA
ncbi:MAG: hypothetical protein JWM11_4072 [Planctomycetaceae bacterium]|nr:hypothetical protein [Planctomycetaceae bacterium]